MPRPFKWIVIGGAVLLPVVAGVTAAVWLSTRDVPQGALDTQLTDVTVTKPKKPRPKPKPPKPKDTSDKLCWRYFGGDPQRSLSRTDVKLGPPTRNHLWTRTLDGYIEYPPSYCDGTLYVNSFRGT